MRSSFCHLARVAWLPVVLAASFSSTKTYGAWETVPDLALNVETTDNIQRSAVNPRSGSRSELDLGATLRGFNRRGRIELEPSLSTDAYGKTQDKALESTDYFFLADGQYSWQKAQFVVRSDYSHRSVLRAVFADVIPQDPNVEQPVDVSSGIVGAYTEIQRRLVSTAALNFNLSERNNLRFQLLRQNLSYSQDNSLAGRTGFGNTRFSLQFGRQIDRRMAATVDMFVSNFSAVSNDNGTRSTGLEGGLTRSMSQTWTVGLTGGMQRSDYSFIDANTQSRLDRITTAYLVGAHFKKRGLRSVWNLDLTHNVDPSTSGFLSVRNQLWAYLQQQLTPRLVGQFGVRYFTTATLGNASSIDERHYGRLTLGFRWAVKRTLFLTFGVDSFNQRFLNQLNPLTTQNSVFVGVNYRGLSKLNYRRR